MTFPLWLVFVLLTYLLSIPIYLKLRRLPPAGEDRAPLERAVRQLMWVPGIVAFGLILYTRAEAAAINLVTLQLPWLLLVALLLPLGMEFLLVFAAVRLNLGRIDSEIFSVQDGWVYLSPAVRLVLGQEKQTIFKFAVNIMATAGIAVAFTLIFSFAEELGWRGYLQDRLIQSFTLTWGLVIGGLFWSVAYIPPILKGYRFQEYPRLGAFVFMPIFLVSVGIITGWLYRLSGSLWVPAIFNASVKVSAMISDVALGEAGGSRRVRIVWLWLWGVLAGLAMTLWYAGL